MARSEGKIKNATRSLFDDGNVKTEVVDEPLASRMRPRTFDEFVGQQHLVGENKVLRKSIEADRVPSLILWGPPGSGKTTLANIIANVTSSCFVPLSAVTSGVADIRRVVGEAKDRLSVYKQRTILFVDEIHRFNKAQQDAILPFVEDGTVTFIGATTENPSFEVISPLLSRCRLFTLDQLSDKDLRQLVNRVMEDQDRGLGGKCIVIDKNALDFLLGISNGDARMVLNALEVAVRAVEPNTSGQRVVELGVLQEVLQQRALVYDKSGEQHFNLISALHKSLRGSDPNAGLYWLGRMLESGEDPLYIARRLVRFASEDIGMADPYALGVTVASQQAVHFLGMPEGNLALAQAVVYLATAPKSNSLYSGYSNVQRDVRQLPSYAVPLHIRNAVTPLMEQQGYGKDYKYAHDHPGHFVEQQYLPPELQHKRYYVPSDEGFEKEVADRLKSWWGDRK
ncbi:MAG: replication-associated recombination protein A [Chloroflexota bacterium]|nr:replication-associated recombination protein A [Chloroflexota bacterium]